MNLCRMPISELPKTDWRVWEKIDHGKATADCEYCGKERVRYGYLMKHRIIDDLTILVGASCMKRLQRTTIIEKKSLFFCLDCGYEDYENNHTVCPNCNSDNPTWKE